MQKVNDPSKHHYIPQFLLRWWAGKDHKFERYSRPTPNKIAVRRVFPSETGWMKDLYASPGSALGNYWLETRIFQVIDNNAANAVRTLNFSPSCLPDEERAAWTLFIRSLSHRTPEYLRATLASGEALWGEVFEELRATYSDRRGPNDPETFDELKRNQTPATIRMAVQRILPNIIVNPLIGELLYKLPTRIITLPNGFREFLLSDDPLLRTNGIMKPDGHIAIPISPRKLFVSAWTMEFLDQIAALAPSQLSANVNRWQVESARHFVVAGDRSQDRFIRNRFGTDLKMPLVVPCKK